MNPSWLFFAGLLALGASAPVGPYNNRQYGAGPAYRGHQGATSTSETYGFQSSTTSHSGSAYQPQGGRPYAGHVPSGRYGPAAPAPPARRGGHYGAVAPQAPGHYGRPSAPSRPQLPSRPHGPSAPSYRGGAHAAPSHYGAQQQHRQPSGNRYGAPHGTSHGREMKYTIQDPYKGTTHVTETHIVSNKEMHGAEAEAAMKQLMGSMGPSSYGPSGNFHQLASGVGLPFY